MLVHRLTKETGDVSRVTIDFTTDVPFLDAGETISAIVSQTVTLGTPGWSSSPPASVVPYDPTTLVLQSATTVVGTAGANTAVRVFVNSGTPGNVYTVQMILVGTSGRHLTIEIAVQLSGTPPVPNPFPSPAPGTLPGYLPLTGGTLTGALYASRDPLTSTEVATKNYIDALIGVATVGNEAARATAAEGTLTTNLAAEVVRATAAEGTNATNIANEITRATTAEGTNATNIANEITRATAAETANATASSHNVGRNFVDNGLFWLAQRGTGPFTTTGVYTLDRWQTSLATDTMSVSQVALADAHRVDIGNEQAEFCLTNTWTSAGSAPSFNNVTHKIEDVYRLSGKTITVSFWARATAGTPKLGVSTTQHFGTGGSPSANVDGNGQSVTISTTFARYQLTFTLASVFGKTLGSSNSDQTQIHFWFSSGSNINVLSGGVGVQASGTISLWGVQVEIGSVATPIEIKNIALELMACQRYYNAGNVVFNGYGVTTAGAGQTYSFPTQMRTAPSIGIPTNTSTNINTLTAGNIGTKAIFVNGLVTATGGWTVNIAYTASSDL